MARALLEMLGDRAALLPHDAYYRSLPPERSPDSWNFDHPDALETELLVQHVDSLLAGEHVHVPTYEFAHHRRAPSSAWVEVAPRPVVVVEGILVLADAALRDRMDVRVFVETPDDVRLVRRIRRDIEERGRTVTEVLDQYLATVRPMHEAFVSPSRDHAHHVMDGTRPVHQLVDQLLSQAPSLQLRAASP